ncbi:uncharacterized protein LOC107613247 isoform X4 [Arachis ipaensis]|uniref:uncharacterized protein LOC107613247 isoform X4 n=1 Tax=Arachis ipaensis TaxID=130454 RepID=UPI000A2B57A7|nr:uncharacterized protein LOC107613247 isoform X4 [Arachis ipaensis]
MAMAGCSLVSTFPLKLKPLKTKTSSSNLFHPELAFVTSHLSGIKISYHPSPMPLLAPSPKFLPLQPLARCILFILMTPDTGNIDGWTTGSGRKIKMVDTHMLS